MKTVVFESGQEEYAISVQSVVSIEKVEFINPIPHMPFYMKGMTKMREELIPVIDFECLLYNQQLADPKEGRLLVVQLDYMPVGFLVKDAKEIIDIPQESFKQMGIAAYEKTKYFTGVAVFSERLITVVDANLLVSSLEGMKEIQEYVKNSKNPVN